MSPARAFTVLACLTGTLFATAEDPAVVVPASTARILPIAGDGWAGSSVNVIAGLQNSLITDRSTQYAAFYAADATVVLARREIGSDAWTSVRTGLRGRVANAHNTIAIAVDGEGYLHVAWDHHSSPLNYARSIAPGSLELGPREPMTGQHETSVTYPTFLRLPDGDLLCIYRDGRSGRGNLVLNRYSPRTRTWSQVQTNLIDGEGQRSAYHSAAVDRKGGLHLAWVWRDSADVASNHDLCYARSSDGGVTWTTTAGTVLPVPLTAANAEYAARIGTNRSLMNPPSLAVDGDGHPYLANYWSPEGTDIPQYHLVHHDGQTWQTQQITQRTTPFTLAGTNTKRPPLSRSVLFTQRGGHQPQEVYLVYRDDERGGRIVVAECRDFARPEWRIHDLTTSTVGAWEPSMDPQQWSRFAQLHLLVQNVQQRDGNDQHAAEVAPTTVSSLIWSPSLAGLGADDKTPLPAAPAGCTLAPPTLATNPIVTHLFTADPAARVFNDRLYVYTSHDEPDATYFDMFDWRLFSTADLATWQDHGSIFHLKDFAWAEKWAWAPDAVHANGRYYLFLPTDRARIGVAIGATPTGPFHDAIGHPLLDKALMPEVGPEPIDPAVLLDDDGSAYLYFGCRFAKVVKLAPSLTALAGPVQDVALLDPQGNPVPVAAPEKQPALPMGYGEAPFVFKRGGLYYFVYSNGWAPASTLVYATGTAPTGPFTYQGEVMKHVPCVTHHGSVVAFRGTWYVVYHTSELSGGNMFRRAVCIDELTFDSTGRIVPVVATPASTSRLR